MIDPASVAALVTSLVILLSTSVLDLQDRRVPNRAILILGISGLFVGLVTGHLVNQILLHLLAGACLILPLSLYRLKAIGGADVKVLMLLAIVSPGIELTTWDALHFEAFIACALQVLVMLLLGSVWSRKRDDTRRTPLIPFLLIGYLIVQLLALV